jgi:hypothetical protein
MPLTRKDIEKQMEIVNNIVNPPIRQLTEEQERFLWSKEGQEKMREERMLMAEKYKIESEKLKQMLKEFETS